MNIMPDSDERQVATTLEGIRHDHVARYTWAQHHVRGRYASPETTVTVADYGCGVGYGTHIMKGVAQSALGFERDEATLCFARDNWRTEGVGFCRHDLEKGAPVVMSDVATAFEIIEHLKDPRPFLRSLNATLLFASVPNEDVFPWEPGILHHYRHYTVRQFYDLLTECGWQVEVLGVQTEDAAAVQEVPEYGEIPGGARTLCVLARRYPAVSAVAAVPTWKHPTENSPESVILCGLGPSKYELLEGMVCHDYDQFADELWTINKGISILPNADVAFVMDDIADYAKRFPAYGRALRDFEGHIIGQSLFPTEVEGYSILYHDYPLREVLNAWGNNCENWLHTISIGYVLAYAGLIGVKKLFLAGIDCSWPGKPHLTEAGNAVVCYWIGRLAQLGCEVIINSESALNSTNLRNDYAWRKFYGYLRQPV